MPDSQQPNPTDAVQRIFFSGFLKPHLQTALRNYLTPGKFEFVGLMSNNNFLTDRIDVFLSQHQAYRIRDFTDVPYKQLPPGDLLEAMRPVETVCLKMMDRHSKNPFLPRQYEYRKRFYLATLSYAYGFLLQHRFQRVVFTNLPHNVFDFVLHELSTQLGIKSSFFYQIQVKDSFLHSESIADLYRPLTATSAAQPHDNELPAHLQAEIDQRTEEARPFYMSNRGLSPWLRFYRKQKRIFRVYTYTQALFATKSYLTYLRLPKRDEVPVEPYVYFAMHYQPEATTSPMGGVFVDQYLAILMLARALPESHKLVVKEHPRQRFWQRYAENYKLLVAEPNIVIVTQQVDSAKLSRRATAVATITGTVGWEALFQQKPVLLFGNIFYQGLPGVVNVRSSADIKQFFAALEANEFAHCSLDDIRELLQAIASNAYAGVLDSEYFRNSVFSEQQSIDAITAALDDVVQLPSDTL